MYSAGLATYKKSLYSLFCGGQFLQKTATGLFKKKLKKHYTFLQWPSQLLPHRELECMSVSVKTDSSRNWVRTCNFPLK